MSSKADDPASNDPRVNFVQSAVYNLCALKDGQIDEANTYGVDSIGDFLDNLNCLRLQATVTKDENNAWNLEFFTEDRPKRIREGRALCGVDFVKLRAEPLKFKVGDIVEATRRMEYGPLEGGAGQARVIEPGVEGANLPAFSPPDNLFG